jgi:hypothetical protein
MNKGYKWVEKGYSVGFKKAIRYAEEWPKALPFHRKVLTFLN